MKPKIKQLGALKWSDDLRKWLQCKPSGKSKVIIEPKINPRRKRIGKYGCVPLGESLEVKRDKKELAKQVSVNGTKRSNKYNLWKHTVTLTEYNL